MFIYKVTNLINDKVYIGQTIRSVEKRKSEHIYRAYKKINNRFYNALIKYGVDNFNWEIIETCINKEFLNENEKYYISLYDSTNPSKGYNYSCGGSNEYKQKNKYIFTEERRIELIERMKNRIIKDDTRKKLSDKNRGKKHTEDSKKKMSIAKKGKSLNKGKIISEETKKKLEPTFFKKGRIPWNKGKPCSEESKIKQSLTKKNKKLYAKYS